MSQQFSRREFLQLMGTMPLLAAPTMIPSSKSNANTPNVLVLVFDALSAKHLALYGYARDTSPHIARFAEKANVYHQHYSAGNFTTPGTASILTGLYPSSHRALQAYATVKQEFRETNMFSHFRKAGFHTLAFSQNLLVNILLNDFMDGLQEFIPADIAALVSKEFSDDFFSRDYGIAVQAERTYLSPLGQFPNSLFLSLISKFIGQRNIANLPKALREEFPRGFPQNHDMYYILEDLIDWAIDYIPNLPSPSLAYLHFMPPHDPYLPRKEFIGKFSEQDAQIPEKPEHFFSEGRTVKFLDNKREQYDEYISYVDAEFGRLISALESSGSLDNTILVLTSDHGELFERGIYRHITPVLFEGISRVPLLIRFPGQQERVDIQSPTNNVDIFPTLLDASGLDVPSGLDGQAIGPENVLSEDRVIFTVDAKSNPKNGPLNLGTISAIKNREKLIHYFGYDDFNSEFEFFDLGNDPEELRNVYSANGASEKELMALIQSLRG